MIAATLKKTALILCLTGLPVQAHDMSGHNSENQSEWAAFGVPGRAGDPARTITISAGDKGEMRFSPAEVTIRRGETIRFLITNRGPIKHEFVIGNRPFHLQHEKEMEAMPDMPMDEANSVDLGPGQTKTLMWRFTKTGEFLFACDIPGHMQAGMYGKMYVR